MAQTTKTKLKAHFQAGDIPSEGNYVDLIDSNLNLKETGTQIIVGTLSSSFLEVENHITASGNISASGDITTTNITALGNISASGTITSPLIQTVKIESQPAGNTLELKSNDLYHNGTSFRTDGNISSSGAIIGSTLAIDSITSTAAELNLLNNVSGLVQADFTKLAAVNASATEINYLDGVLSTVKDAYDGVTNVSQGNIRFTELDNGTEDLALTGLRTGDIPTFAGLDVGKTEKPSVGEYGGTLTVNLGGKAITFTIEGIPTIPAANEGIISKPTPTLIRNASVTSTDMIIVNCIDAPLSVVVYGQKTAADAGVEGFYIVLGNESTTSFTNGTATFSCLII